MLCALWPLGEPSRMLSTVAEESPLVRQPTTPSERFRSTLLLLKLSRPDLAKEQIAKLLSEDVTDEQLLEIRSEYGSAMFLRLANSEALRPESTQLLDRVTAAAAGRRADPAYVDELLSEYDVSPEARRAAARELDRMVPNVVPTLLQRADADAGEVPKVQAILNAVGPRGAAAEAAVAMLSPRDGERLLALRALERTAGPREVAALAAIAADDAAAANERAAANTALERLGNVAASFDAGATLRTEAKDLLDGRAAMPVDDGGNAVFFELSDDGTVRRSERSEADARLRLAMRYLRRAVVIDGDDRPSADLLTVLRMNERGDDAAVAYRQMLRVGGDTTRRAATTAMELDLDRAAATAIRGLSLVGDRNRLTGGPEASPIIRALDSPSPEVAFAAAEAVVALRPTTPFMNSQRVPEILVRELNSESNPKVVIIDPNQRRAGDIGGRFAGLGLTPVIAENETDGFETIARRGDVAMVAVNAAAQGPTLASLLANLAADARTASIPVALYAETGVREQYEGDAARYPNVTYVPTLADTATLQTMLQRQLTESLQPVAVPDAAQPSRRVRAAELLRALAVADVSDVFPLTNIAGDLRAAAFDPSEAVALEATTTLGFVAAPEVQASLVDLVTSANGRVREVAMAALLRNIRDFGRSLSGESAAKLSDAEMDGSTSLLNDRAAALGLLSD